MSDTNVLVVLGILAVAAGVGYVISEKVAAHREREGFDEDFEFEGGGGVDWAGASQRARAGASRAAAASSSAYREYAPKASKAAKAAAKRAAKAAREAGIWSERQTGRLADKLSDLDWQRAYERASGIAGKAGGAAARVKHEFIPTGGSRTTQYMAGGYEPRETVFEWPADEAFAPLPGQYSQTQYGRRPFPTVVDPGVGLYQQNKARRARRNVSKLDAVAPALAVMPIAIPSYLAYRAYFEGDDE